jgi:hypothetical protein
MGIETVRVVHSVRWANLSPNARLVFAMMAGTCLDHPKNGQPARRYWGGHDTLIHQLAGAEPGAPAYPTGQKRVTRAIRELIESGAITRHRAGHKGRQAEYELHPDPFGGNAPQPVDNPRPGPLPLAG